MEPFGFVIVRVQVLHVAEYNEHQIALVLDDPSLDTNNPPAIMGKPTLYQVINVIWESEISKLAIPWAAVWTS